MASYYLLENGTDRLLTEAGDLLTIDERTSGQVITAGQGSVVGDIAVALVGIAIAASTGTITANADGSVALIGQEIVSQQTAPAPDFSRAVTGIAVTVSDGVVTISNTIAPSDGLQINSAQGFVSASGNDVTVNISGVEATFEQGFVQGGYAFLSGHEDTFAAGTVVPSNTVALTGSEIASGIGTVSPAQEADDTYIASAIGNTTPAISVALLGSAITSAQGSLGITADVTQALTTQAITSAAGSVGFERAFELTGSEITGEQGNFGAPGGAALTGQSISVLAGNVFTTNDREFALTGLEITSLAGDTFASSLAFPAGQEMTISQQEIGPRGATLTGLEITSETGFVGAPSSGSKDAGKSGPHRRDNKPKPVLVEIDGEQFYVANSAEAKALLEQTAELAQEQAQLQLEKARESKLRSSKLKQVVEHKLQPPQISASGDAEAAIAAEEMQREIAELYARTVQEALLQRQKQEQEEEDFILGLFL